MRYTVSGGLPLRTIVAKLDDETCRQLDEMAGDRPRSEIVRTAIRQFLARQRFEKRKREVEEYMRTRTAGEAEMMRELAEADMDHAAELLARVESET
jgi:predicted transcriptional regulator